jgi:putative lipoprotein
MTFTAARPKRILPSLLAGAGFLLSPLVAPSQTNNVRPAIKWQRFDYTCEAGGKLTVYLHDTTAKIRYQDRIYLLRQTPSADGNRYSDSKVLWWGKGAEGFLQEEAAGGDGKMLAGDCRLDTPPSAATKPGTITGTVSYMLRIALPPTATIQVQMQELALSGAPPKLVAEDNFILGNRQVPVAFTLKFDPAEIDPKRAYGVSARILVDGEVRFLSEQAYPVLTQGNPFRIELVLQPARDGKP